MNEIQWAWTIVFGVSVGLFIIVGLVVIIGGAKDVIDIMATLDNKAQNHEGNDINE